MPSSLEHLIFKVKTPNFKVKTRNFRAVRKVLEQLAGQETLRSKTPKRQSLPQNGGVQTRQSGRVLTYPELKLLKGIPYSRQHLYRLEKAGEFPCRFSPSAGRVVWWEYEIDEWLRIRSNTRI